MQKVLKEQLHYVQTNADLSSMEPPRIVSSIISYQIDAL